MSGDRPRIYGPVPSRRLGSSLGVDLVPPKTCDYDCVYCQLGRTTNHTAERKPYVRAGDIIDELSRTLEAVPRPDYITMAGSGEPTLNTELAGMISRVKEISDVPVAVITNGSLLWDREVQDACLDADLVLPSLDAGDDETFRNINRPCAGVEFDAMVEGLVEFRRRYSGKVWLEVMLLEGFNDSEGSIDSIGRHVERIKPDETNLNTVRRPPVDLSARRVSDERLEEIRRYLGKRAQVLDPSVDRGGRATGGRDEEDLLALIERRPCTRRQIADIFNINEIEALKRLSGLMEENLVVSEQSGGEVYYRALPPFTVGGDDHNRT